MTEFSRRQVLTGLAVLGINAADVRWTPRLPAQAPERDPALVWPPAVTGISPAYPTHDGSLAKEIVGVAHHDLDRVKALVSRQPNLAEAAWDVCSMPTSPPAIPRRRKSSASERRECSRDMHTK
jgi:hypothetical protein